MGWTLIDHFESDGRRWVLAVDNRPECPGIEHLSERECDVLRLALLGQHNKAIAYDLGLAHSTVRVLLARAAAKVGATSRDALLEKARVLPPETFLRGRRVGHSP
jgi:DNA-binding CsgD family transcriptional regulator